MLVQKRLVNFGQVLSYLATYYCEDIETNIDTPKFRGVFRKTGAYYKLLSN